MKTTSLNTFAAGLLACVCLAGMSESTMAQFFSSDAPATTDGRGPVPQDNDAYGHQPSHQWRDRETMDRRYIRTNSSDGTLPQQDYRARQGRCADGQCQRNPGEHISKDGTAAYRGRRSRGGGMAEGREYPLRRAMATGWDPTNPEAVDPTIGRPMERSYRSGHDHANGEHHRGHGRCRDCVHGQCECPDGQCPLRGLQIERSGLSAFEDAWGNGCGRCSKVRGFLGTVAVVTGWAMAIDSLANDAVSGEDDKTDLIRYDPDSTQPLKAAVAAGIQVV